MRPALLISLTVAALTAMSAAHAGSRLSGSEQLARLLQTHSFQYPITQAVKNATGDPNITVIDRRGRPGSAYYCSFLNRYGRRVLVCDSL